MPHILSIHKNVNYGLNELHQKVKQTKVPNYIGARIPVDNQLNIDEWKCLLADYWDQQLLKFLEFGFPVGFHRDCLLQHSLENPHWISPVTWTNI